MSLSWIRRMLMRNGFSTARLSHSEPNLGRFLPNLESLEDRAQPAITAFFLQPAGLLTIFGDAGNNSVTISRDAAGSLKVNNSAVTILGGKATVANTTSINVYGLGGNDVITLDETNGALPKALLFGGDGNDTLVGGSGIDQLFGQAGNDVLLGKANVDLLFGGAGNDLLTGGVGDDQVFGEAGNDRMIWNPGEGSDINEGGAGIDTVEINGGNGAETFTITANGARVRFDRVAPAPFFVDIGTSESLVLNANGGDDVVTAGNGLATLIQLTIDGGTGNDTITGGDGVDSLFGGDGNDVVNGGRGNDTVFLGAGDDTFIWNPGDGSDIVEGQAGNDTMVFNGANVSEIFDLAANGERVRLARNIGAIAMDLNDVERVDINALNGADTITVNDLTGTDVTQVNLSLSVVGGDALTDVVIVNGTSRNDIIDLFGSGTSVSVVGLPAQVNITNLEAANDSLAVNALSGDDGLTASTLPAGILKLLTLDGGNGNNRILGSAGADMLLASDGNDFFDGQQGNDVARMGAGDDIFQWDAGDGSDAIEGEAGTDTLFFFGSDVGENFDLSANGGRVRFTRNVGNVTMDMDDVEKMQLRTLGGADNVVISDLAGTDLTRIEIALRSSTGGSDGVADTITVSATQGNDTFSIAGDVGGLRVLGLPLAITVFDQDPALDSVTLNGLGGNDTIGAQSLVAGSVRLVINGGDGDDTITGSGGDDAINGGRGNDVAMMGAGDDTFVWNPGDGSDVVEGQDGLDAMVFNGANINEKIELSANGQRLRLTRDVANVTMDANGVERVDVNALGGADTITVNDLTGTDLAMLNLSLSAVGGAGDGAADQVIVNGANGDDAIVAFGDANGVSVIGLAAQVNITGAESANDRLLVNALGGDDVVDASGLLSGAIQFTADGGEGDDVLIGSSGNDTLLGGTGDDVLIGGDGQDVLDGGTGDNIVIQ